MGSGKIVRKGTSRRSFQQCAGFASRAAELCVVPEDAAAAASIERARCRLGGVTGRAEGMHVKRMSRVGAGAAACLLAGLVVAGPAAADSPEVFAGSATATALNLSVAGNALTLGTSAAKVTSEPLADATGAGQVTPVATVQQESKASAATPTDTKAKACGTPSLPAQVSAILDVGLVCSATTASIANAAPTATGLGSIATVDLSSNTILSQLGAVTDPLQQALNPIIGQLPQGTTVQDLITSVLKTQTLSTTVGEANSSVVTDAGTVTSTASSAGAVIKLLPTPSINGAPSTDPVATIRIGSAKATAIYNRSAGTSSATQDPAIVSIAFNPTLGLPPVSVAVNSPVTILAGTPLETTINVAGGTSKTNPDGSATATADGVSVQALKGLPGGGITLQLAHAEAAVNGTKAVVTPPAPATPVAVTPRGELPRTGGTPRLPIAGPVLPATPVTPRRSLRRLS